MGIFQPGLLIDFDCNGVLPNSLTGNATVTLATVSLTIESSSNTVWLTAYATWSASNTSNDVKFTFVRDDGKELCSATDHPASVDTFTTAFTCCDKAPLTGTHSYQLQATGVGPNKNTTFTFTTGDLTGAVINT
ncbi:hypothetical protein BGM26_13370 [Bacillus sp. FJAT-29790]|uniref:hypothetical protein n=1 Tax=Bacillus sp. FJAT-29790 TaxID=1895002 RepID=UPI001C22EF5B|nr:hypothetical protein [Bacillus sp. FJAT-29790]MBU8879969.1 hypothetical protein [Bacillus sp. FJAT-29790]